MKLTLHLLGLLLAGAACGLPGRALAQTPTIEFAPGAGNTTGNGPVTTNQVITFQNNTNNPSGNSFVAYNPTLTATFSLSNQQYTRQSYAPGTGVSFGANFADTGTGTAPAPLFTAMNSISFTGISTATANSYFSAASGTTGGIDVTANNAVQLYTSTLPLPRPVPANQRYRYADLTITFNRTVSNPVIQLVGLGGFYGNAGFSTELDLLTAGVTLSKLDGSSELTVSNTGGVSNLGQINNSRASPDATTNAGAASGSVLVTTPAAGITTLTFRVYLRPLTAGGDISGGLQSGDVWLIGVSGRAAVQPIAGYVYEDVNYGGGAGRPRSVAGSVGRPNARVELYNAAGAFVSATTTDSNGRYAFTPGTAGTYTVRVVNSSVTSSRPGTVAGLLPVQTYNGTTTQVGGQAPERVDAGNGAAGTTLASLNTATTIAESQAVVTVSYGSPTATGADFGYNFDTVVNTNDAGQGSLRQFISNANALGGEASLAQAGFYTNAVDLSTGATAAGAAGVGLPTDFESSIFMIPAGRLTGGVAIIAPTAALPQITGANTAINGATQTFNIGNTNDVQLGIGGTVGTNSTALSQLNGPEVQLVGSPSVAIGLNVAGEGSQVRGLAIYGFGSDADNNSFANIALSANNIAVADNAIGSAATSFAVPPVANGSSNVRVISGTGNSFTNNLIGFAGGTGIYLANAVTTTSIVGNEIRNNARLNTLLDGIDSHGSSTTATGNLFADNTAQGFDSFGSTGSNTITGNTFTNNGIGSSNAAPQETAAVRLYGTGNTFSQNSTTANYGAGVEIANGTTTITRNSIYNNGTIASANGTVATGQVGIDLLANSEDQNVGTAPFVTLNSGATTGANGLSNYPILRTANIVGTNLVLRGYAKAGAVIELFAAQTNATGANFGQGRDFLLTLTEGATTGISDTDASTAQRYSGNINGFDQGTDTDANGFTFTIPLALLPGGTLAAGTVLTSTATLNGATSEFSGNVTAVSGPLPVVLAAFTAQAGQNREALLRWTTASEVHSAYFDVERSLNGTTFTSIGRQTAQGTSIRSTSYTFTDAGIAAQTNGPVYYRLHQVDLDASASYSPVRTVAFGPVAATTLSLSPNPARQTTGLDLQLLPGAATYRVAVLDVTGRIVRQLSLGGGRCQPLDLAGLVPGSYYVLVTGESANGSALRQTLHLIKE